MDNYININALDVEFKTAERGAISFEDWANENDLYFVITELDGMDLNLSLGTHEVVMYKDEVPLDRGRGDGVLEAFIDLIKKCAGCKWRGGEKQFAIEAPQKFKGIK